jgi:hypothetical protein
MHRFAEGAHQNVKDFDSARLEIALLLELNLLGE